MAGALLSTWMQRYVIILGTAFGGAWTIIVGAAALMGNPTALKAAAAGDVWVAYPMNPAPGQEWVPWTFIAVGAVGTLVQMYGGWRREEWPEELYEEAQGEQGRGQPTTRAAARPLVKAASTRDPAHQSPQTTSRRSGSTSAPTFSGGSAHAWRQRWALR